jgi:hypothetical protein
MSKIASLIVCCVFGLIISFMAGVIAFNLTENRKLNEQINGLVINNTNLQTRVNELEQKITIKPFASEDSLRLWLGKNDRNITMKDRYPSEIALQLIRDARDEGYYMGITGYFEIDSLTQSYAGTYGKYLVTLDATVANKIGNKQGKVVCNTAIVGDGEIYLIYPLEDRVEYLCATSKSK